jgi:hypothetical protein
MRIGPDGSVPMYRTDSVSFEPNGYWPTVTGTGSSIERSPFGEYGNDPALWRAAAVFGSPGFSTEYQEPFMSSISSSAEGYASVGFAALYAQAYEIEYTDSMTEPDWQLLTVVQFAPSNWVEVADPSSTSNSRYSRIIWHSNTPAE